MGAGLSGVLGGIGIPSQSQSQSGETVFIEKSNSKAAVISQSVTVAATAAATTTTYNNNATTTTTTTTTTTSNSTSKTTAVNKDTVFVEEVGTLVVAKASSHVDAPPTGLPKDNDYDLL